jgi:signal transduction histidine kinase
MAEGRSPRGGSVRVWTLSLFLLCLSATLLQLFARDLFPPLSHPRIPWWVMVLAFALAEGFVVHLGFARHAHSFSLVEIPLVVGLVYTSPLALVLSQTLGVTAVLTLLRGQKSTRVAFNLGQRSLTTVLAVFGFHAVIQIGGSGWPVVWGAGFASMILADLLAGILINLAISLSEDTPMVLDQVIGAGTAFTISTTALALVTSMVLHQHPAAIVLVVAPAGITYLAGRSYAALRRKHENLQLLYQSTRLAQRSLNVDALLQSLLGHAREMFHADTAEIVLLHDGKSGSSVRTAIGPGDQMEVMAPFQMDPLEGVWARALSEGRGVLLPRPMENRQLAKFFDAQGIRDAIVVPLVAEEGPFGTMMVANRIGDFTTFDSDDLELLETLGNHVAVALRNATLVQRLEEGLARETEMNSLKDEFLATVSHELRTPLTNVQGYIKTLLRPDLLLKASEERDFLERADRQAERLRHLIEELLFVSKTEASPSGVPTEEVWLPELLKRAREDTGQTDQQRVEIHVEPGLPMLRTSQEHLYRIVRNLIDNAIKYSPLEGPVTLSARRDADGIVVAVRDRGDGIPEGERDRIFDRFYQVDQSMTRRVGGTGMGLYICRRAADLISGRVWLEDSGPEGSVFSLWLPLEPMAAGRLTRSYFREFCDPKKGPGM